MEERTKSFGELQEAIEEARRNGESTVPFVRQQIRLLEMAHDEFIIQAQAKGYSLSDPRVGEIEVQQYAAMRQLAEQIGDSVEKYDLLIRRCRERVLGVENIKRFFGY